VISHHFDIDEAAQIELLRSKHGHIGGEGNMPIDYACCVFEKSMFLPSLEKELRLKQPYSQGIQLASSRVITLSSRNRMGASFKMRIPFG
jgi:hypothetical protein